MPSHPKKNNNNNHNYGDDDDNKYLLPATPNLPGYFRRNAVNFPLYDYLRGT